MFSRFGDMFEGSRVNNKSMRTGFACLLSLALFSGGAHAADIVKGKLVSVRSVTIAGEITGQRTVVVDKILVHEGDRVKQGEVLAQLKTDQTKSDRIVNVAALAEAEAMVDAAESALKGANNQMSRQSGLEHSAAFRRSTFEDAQVAVQTAASQLKLAQASVLRRKAEIERIDVEIRNAEIVAPFDALVVQILSGQGSALTQTKPEIMKLVERDRVEIQIRAKPEKLTNLKLNQKIEYDLGDGHKRAAEILAVIPSDELERQDILLRLRLDGSDLPSSITDGQAVTLYLGS